MGFFAAKSLATPVAHGEHFRFDDRSPRPSALRRGEPGSRVPIFAEVRRVLPEGVIGHGNEGGSDWEGEFFVVGHPQQSRQRAVMNSTSRAADRGYDDGRVRIRAYEYLAISTPGRETPAKPGDWMATERGALDRSPK